MYEGKDVYIFRWKNNKHAMPFPYPLRKYFSERCSVLKRGKMNSILIMFEDGTKHVVSRYAVRKI